MRFLEEGELDDHDELEDNSKQLMTIKIIVLVFMFIAGAFVFIPYYVQ